MKSHEVLKETIANSIGIKALAPELSLSPSLLYKWCEPKKDDGSAGTDNPLDRVEQICRLTGNVAPIIWLCEQMNGFYTKNTAGSSAEIDALLPVTQKILREFSELLEAISMSANDGRVTEVEAAKIRKEWEDLKRISEQFVIACEKKQYNS
jgi:transposase-like protein